MNIAIWPGSSSFYPGKTPFGFYDNDYQFQIDADSVANYCANKLGYPIMAVEMQDLNFYTCFEEAVTEFNNQVNMYNARDYMLTLQGSSTSVNLTGRVVSTNLGRVVELAKNYGSEAGSGGNVTWKTGSIELQPNVQSYDLDLLWTNVKEIGRHIEVKRIYHDFSPAIVRYFDPYVGTGAGTQQMLDSFGWGGYSPGVSFLVMPLYADLLRIQAIEMNDQIRKSAYTFELKNNKLKIFPLPSMAVNLHFEYIVLEERNAQLTVPTGSVSDLSNIPYNRMVYTNITPLGKNWVFKYTLALAKELQGLIRNKYSTVPIPGAEVTLNGADLITQGREDKANLLTELRESLEIMTRKGQMQQEKDIAEAMNYQLSKVPLQIYIK
tara:strand:- start:2636 stop:3775 length:1140 start_codon:yes stop_codon:yes gene_type:complete